MLGPNPQLVKDAYLCLHWHYIPIILGYFYIRNVYSWSWINLLIWQNFCVIRAWWNSFRAICDSVLPLQFHCRTTIDNYQHHIPRSPPSYWLASNSALNAKLLYMKSSWADPGNLAQALKILYSGSATSLTYNHKYLWVNLDYWSVLFSVTPCVPVLSIPFQIISAF